MIDFVLNEPVTLMIIIVLSYLMGTVNPAHMITRYKKKVDIRKVNSKNAGTSNVMMTVGFRYAVIVGILDMLKGFLPVIIVRFIFQADDALWVIAGVSSIVGHIFPLHLGFKGGKGTATFGGVCFGLFPLVSLVLFILFFLVLILSDYIVVPTILAVTLVPTGMLFTNFHLLGIVLLFMFAVLSIYKHLPNIIRLYKREEVGLRKALKK